MSGKSTLIKHMMCMTGSVSLPERQALKPIILSSVSMAMSLIVEEAKALGVFRYDPELKSHARTIATLSGHSTDPTAVYKIPRALKALWADERIVKVFYGCREQYPGLDDAVE